MLKQPVFDGSCQLKKVSSFLLWWQGKIQIRGSPLFFFNQIMPHPSVLIESPGERFRPVGNEEISADAARCQCGLKRGHFQIWHYRRVFLLLISSFICIYSKNLWFNWTGGCRDVGIGLDEWLIFLLEHCYMLIKCVCNFAPKKKLASSVILRT